MPFVSVRRIEHSSRPHHPPSLDKKIPLEGMIALQTHGGPAFQVRYKDITIREFKTEKGLPTWKDLGEEGKKPWPRKK